MFYELLSPLTNRGFPDLDQPRFMRHLSQNIMILTENRTSFLYPLTRKEGMMDFVCVRGHRLKARKNAALHFLREYTQIQVKAP